MEQEKKICAAYIRVSTHDQEEFSPDSQIGKIREYVKAHNMVLSEEYIFRDDGISGRKAEKRPEFLRMIATAKEKPRRFQCILVWKFSRFARNQEESIVYKSLLKKENDIDVVSVSEPILEGPFGGLIERIIEWFDAFYSINLSTEVRRGMTERASRGLPVSTAPLGYRYHDKLLELVPEEADIVRTIYEDFLAGRSMLSIAKKLNAAGLRTKRGNIWENRTVRYVLSNPVYIGKIRWCPSGINDYHGSTLLDDTLLVDGQHEPIISKAEFDRAQDMLEELLERYKGNQKTAQRVDVSWALQGLVRCGACGGTMTWTGQGVNCSRYVHGKCTTSHYIARDRLEQIVNSSLREQLGNMDIQLIHREKPAKDEEQRRLQQRIRQERDILQRCKEAYSAGIDTLEEYKENKQKCQNQILALQKKLDHLAQPEPIDKAAFCQRALSILNTIENGNLPPQEKNVLYRSIVDRITLHKNPMRVDIVYYV